MLNLQASTTANALLFIYCFFFSLRWRKKNCNRQTRHDAHTHTLSVAYDRWLWMQWALSSNAWPWNSYDVHMTHNAIKTSAVFSSSFGRIARDSILPFGRQLNRNGKLKWPTKCEYLRLHDDGREHGKSWFVYASHRKRNISHFGYWPQSRVRKHCCWCNFNGDSCSTG